VLASERVAATLKGPSLRILAAEEIHNFPANDPYRVPGGWEGFADRLYERAGVGPKEMGFAQLYDDYPVMAFVQLEGLGFCKRGGAPAFVRDTDITIRGQLPINTGGGQLSAGQAGASGGMIGLYEAATQLLGRAGQRQVKCRRGLVSGYGMVAYGRGLSSAAAILERAE
jgi:acetyl-CoA acetyltransferase